MLAAEAALLLLLEPLLLLTMAECMGFSSVKVPALVVPSLLGLLPQLAAGEGLVSCFSGFLAGLGFALGGWGWGWGLCWGGEPLSLPARFLRGGGWWWCASPRVPCAAKVTYIIRHAASPSRHNTHIGGGGIHNINTTQQKS